MRLGGGGAVLLLGACSFQAGTASDATNPMLDAPLAVWLTGYQYRKAIHITSPNKAPLADFPIGINLDADGDLAKHARSDGADLVFTDDDGKTLRDRELVSFVPATGALEVWVRVPVLPGGAKQIFVYYGGPASANGGVVWKQPDFAGVWHLSEPQTVGPANDSTVHAHQLTSPTISETPSSVPGAASGARTFDGQNEFLATNAQGLDFAQTSFSFSAWVRVTENAGLYDPPLWKGGTSNGSPGYCFLTGSAGWVVKVHDPMSYYDNDLGTTATFANQWVHVAAVVDRTAMTLTGFVNGTPGTPVSFQPTALQSLATNKPFQLGKSDLPAQFAGAIDEVRIYSIALSPDWIATEHANLADPSFLMLGPEQTH